MTKKLLLEIFKKADLCRKFEEKVFNDIQKQKIKIPVYLSAGQEYAPSVISSYVLKNKIKNTNIFIQHRGHSTYICFGGDIKKLYSELLGRKNGCAQGMGGSASVHDPEARIHGHDGMMGSHGPIACGFAYATGKPVICFAGDAAVEEDYFLASLAWAGSKRLPILFVIEDNDLSILTKKNVRRKWNADKVAKAFLIDAFNIPDNPKVIFKCLKNYKFQKPLLLNVNVKRIFWHSGAGIDDPNVFDRHNEVGSQIPKKLRESIKNQNNEIILSLQ